MPECISCGQNSLYQFRTLEVHTLPVRDFNGEKKVQALGDFKDFSICRSCAQKKLDSILNLVSALIVCCIPGLLVFILGAVLTVLLWHKDTVPLRMFGGGAIFCGVTVLFSIIQKTIKQKKEFEPLSSDEALEKAAWLCVLENAPKKFNENDVSYIPINDKTLKLKNGDLMVLYDLLPQIAVQTFERIHSENFI